MKQPAIQIPEGLAQQPIKRVLLHACCAPCSSAIVEWMLANGLQPTVFYFNPNIFPREEYEIRKQESKRHAESLGLTWIDGDYDHVNWHSCVKGLENEPERGSRCLECFRMRLLATARKAQELGITWFTTTLASSRWKSLEQIAEAGHYAESQVPGTHFWAQNWRKGGLYERRNQLLREFNFYNQQYCGCEYSQRSAQQSTPSACPSPSNAIESVHTSPTSFSEERRDGQRRRAVNLMRKITRWMDRLYLDGVIGLLPFGIGDAIGALFSIIYLYFAACQIRSWALTLAILNNTLRDVLFGLLPFFVGNVIDFFHKSNVQNMLLIDGFLNHDKIIVQEVHRKARQTAAISILLLLTITAMVWLLVWLAVRLGTVLFS